MPSQPFSETPPPQRPNDSRQQRSAVFRILDASINRASEGLRTMEDYARFVLNDKGLSQQLKEARHQLTSIASMLPHNERLAARDTAGDCGTQITTPQETKRLNPRSVCTAAAARTQQALRSLEEFGKCIDVEFSDQIEHLRYRCYTLAQTVERLPEQRQQICEAKLYVLLNGRSSESEFESHIKDLVNAKVDVIQLRDKTLTDRVLFERASLAMRTVRASKGTYRPLLIVNDRADIAFAADADGVHLGQTELPISAARRLLGPDKLIGVSVHEISQVSRATADGADYLGCGPTFPSTTKSFSQYAGIDFLKQVVIHTSLPAFAIGGIDLENLDAVLKTGIGRIAIAGAVANSDSPIEVIQQFQKRLSDS